MRTFIAGIDVDRRLWRDLLRPLHWHVVPAPPQAVTLPTPPPPPMATTNLKSGALAIHRGDGRRQVPGRSRQQHHASTRPGNPSRLHREPPSRSSSRAATASKQGDSDDSSGELSSALCLSDSNREQLATPNAGKQAGSKRKRASSSWHCNIKPAPSISILNRNRMSLCLLRTLLPRVMTATEARRGLILLPIKCSCSAHAYNRGSSRG